eukprot:4272132-Amphidinium_carterae.1
MLRPQPSVSGLEGHHVYWSRRVARARSWHVDDYPPLRRQRLQQQVRAVAARCAVRCEVPLPATPDEIASKASVLAHIEIPAPPSRPVTIPPSGSLMMCHQGLSCRCAAWSFCLAHPSHTQTLRAATVTMMIRT